MTKNKEIYLGKEKISQGWQSEIVMRALKDEKAFKSLWKSYKLARRSEGAGAKEPTALQLKIASYAKESKTSKVLVARKFNVQYHVVVAAIQKVAVWEYLNV